MGISDTIRKGFRLLLSPSREAKGNYSIRKSLKFFYTLAVTGLIFAAVVAALLQVSGLGFSNVSVFSSLATASSQFYWVLLGLAVSLLVLAPVGLFADAALFQLFGKFLLKAWNGTYERTFAAVTAACAPILLLYWLFQLPVVGIGIAVLLSVWEFVLLIIALSVQQKVTRMKALAAILLTLVIVLVVVMAIAFAVLATAIPRMV
jgi:hypothetical protein